MIERFAGSDGSRRLVEAVKSQTIVRGNQRLAERIVDVAELIEVPPGTSIINQNSPENDLFFIVAGCFDISVNGRTVNHRRAGDHVGEMAAIEPSLRRSATVIATEASVVCKITEPTLSALGNEHPEVWRSLAKELAHRLYQRNALVPDARDDIRVFLISSAEALSVARAIENSFEHDPFKINLWTHGTFKASSYPVESLEAELDRSDFAIAIIHPDDVTHTRGTTTPSPRDNVIFELGLFIGRIGRKRSILLEPRDELIKLPSDLTGITTVPYKYDGRELARAISPACNRIRDLIKEMGPHR